MKRKIFTLLMAFIALAAFQMNASPTTTGEVWIKADVTGLNPIKPYPENKKFIKNWLNYKEGKFVVDQGEKIGQKTNRMSINQIGNQETLFTIKANQVTDAPIMELTYGGQKWTQFEIVQFEPDANDETEGKDSEGKVDAYKLFRTPQSLDSDGFIEGYLSVARGGTGQKKSAADTDLMFVVSDGYGNLDIKELSTFATFTPGQEAIEYKPAVSAKFVEDEFAGQVPFSKAAIGNIYKNIYGDYFILSNYVTDGDTEEPEVNFSSPKQQFNLLGALYSTAIQYRVYKADAPGKYVQYMGPTGLVGIFGYNFNNLWREVTIKDGEANYGNTAETSLRPKSDYFLLSTFFTYYNIDETSGGDVEVTLEFKDIASITETTTELSIGDPYLGSANLVNDYTTYTFQPYEAEIFEQEYVAPSFDWVTPQLFSPVYIKPAKIVGRWATEADFDNLECKYLSLPSSIVTGTAPDEVTQILGADGKTVFAVDYVGCVMPESNDRTGLFKHNEPVVDYLIEETELSTPGRNLVKGIPLFTFRAPDACSFLSVSRKGFNQQAEGGTNVIGLQFELRDYGVSYEYDADGTVKESISNIEEYAPLQQYAIWIDDEGKMTIYPAASYKYIYGAGLVQDTEVVENEVLVDNAYPGSEVSYGKYHFELGWYDGGYQVENNKNTDPYFTVKPVKTQPVTVFQSATFSIDSECKDIPVDIAGKFYYMQVKPDFTGLASLGYTPAEIIAFSAREYVISAAEVDDDGNPIVVALPKEKVEENNTSPLGYWGFNPRDSVNMAAHWGLYKTADGFKIINMLGIELAFPSKFGGAVDLWNAYVFEGYDKEGFFLETINGKSLVFNGSWEKSKISSFEFNETRYPQMPIEVSRITLKDHKNIDYGQIPCVGINITLEEIYYVPTYGLGNGIPSWQYNKQIGEDYEDYIYFEESEKDENGKPVIPGVIINTNDKYYVDYDLNGNILMEKDSLTAYAYARGEFKIREVLALPGDDSYLVNKNDLATMRSTYDEATVIEIIPVNLTEIQGQDGGYKWFIIKQKGAEKYLKYDDLDPNANPGDNSLKYGLTFNGTKATATHFRLYQPLTRDKRDGNFELEFYVSEVLKYAHIDTQQANLYATEDGRRATRFSLEDAYNKPTPDVCPDCFQDFVEPEWMAENHLLGMKVTAQDILKDEINTNVVFENDRIILDKNSDPIEISHFLAGYIIDGSYYHGESATEIAKLKNVFESNLFNKDGSAVKIPVYYVYGGNRKYMTVKPETDMIIKDPNTENDVTGTLLTFDSKWGESETDPVNTDYYMPTTQLFVIVDQCNAMEDQGSYSRFVYYPLGSYVIDYNEGDVVKNASGSNYVEYNTNLGYGATCSVTANESHAAMPDMSTSFRIAQYSLPGSNLYSLIVTGASGNGLTNNIPVEFAWTPREYDSELCEGGSFAIKYSTSAWLGTNGTSIPADDTEKLINFALTHYTLEPATDKVGCNLVKFVPEIAEIEGEGVIMDSYLTGEFYMVKGEDNTINLYQFTGTNYFQPWFVDGEAFNYENDPVFEYTCVGHDLPFYDLEADGGFNIEYRTLAIFESILLDRNLNINWNSQVLEGYNAEIQGIKPGEEGVAYVSVFRSNRRQLSPIEDNHVIPYYTFMLTDADKNEYFLNIQPASGPYELDSVKFTQLSAEEIKVLMDHDGYFDEANIFAMPNYKFCLPFALNDRGEVDESVESPLPVYIQSMDLASGNENAPYIIIAGSKTKLATARKVDEAIQPLLRPNFNWSIYTVDYTAIDSDLSNSWTFIPFAEEDVEWVEMKDPQGDDEFITGILANANIQTYRQYVGASGKSPINYAEEITEDDIALSELNFYFVGDNIIGEYAKRQIWYYRIQDPISENYLTDARLNENDDYWFSFGDAGKFAYAYFDEFIEADEKFVEEGVAADTDFLQTFGLRYANKVEEGEEGYSTFYVVSIADYHNKYTPSNDYRYLASINGRYIFVDNPADAIEFIWGGNEDGKFVDIDGASTFGIVGLEGAVNVRNAEGVVEIFTADGRKISSTAVTSADQIISAPAGVVIVRNGANAQRVIVK